MNPNESPAYALALAHLQAGRWSEALLAYEDLLTQAPEFIDGWCDKALALRNLRRYEESLAALTQALALTQTPNADLHRMRGLVLMQMGRYRESVAEFGAACRLRPHDFGLHWAWVMSHVPTGCPAAEEIPQIRTAFAQALNQLQQAVQQGFGQEVAESLVGQFQPFSLAFQEYDNRALLSTYGDICAALMKAALQHQDTSNNPSQPTSTIPIQPEDAGFMGRLEKGDARREPQRYPAVSRGFATPQLPFPGEPETGIFRLDGYTPPQGGKRRLRVGIVSAHLQGHSVWFAITRGWLQHLDPNQFELQLFSLSSVEDTHTQWARTRAELFAKGPHDVRHWVEQLRYHAPDVLIYPEIGMDATALQLASLRLAPIQAASWGHPDTTGLPHIDYFLSAQAFEPEKAQDYYREQLIPLPGIGTAYSPLGVQADKAWDFTELGIDTKHPWFLCPGGIYKYPSRYGDMLLQIAQSLGPCQFIFFMPTGWESQMQAMRARITQRFADSGLDAARYLLFVPWQSRARFFALMQRATAVLDPIGFSGFNTAMQVMEARAPLVALEGRFMRGRLGSGILRQAHLPELVATDDATYAQLAVRLATDPDWRTLMLQRIAQNTAGLFDDRAPINGLADWLRRSFPLKGEG